MSFDIGGLPNFLDIDHLLNRLREAMGAELIQPIDNLRIGVLSLDEILRTTGQEVDISEIEFHNDGTLVFQGRRVILYIRDFTYYNEGSALPKYHVANCATLQSMKERKRYDRYVVATRQDGKFRMKISSNKQTWEEQERALDVCRFCLRALDWNQYNSVAATKRTQIFDTFLIEHFFERYPNSQIIDTPTHTDQTAPHNNYTSDWDAISLAYRESVNWRCEQCFYDLSSVNLRRYLHVHHIDFSRNNNASDNLAALCIECHSTQDGHERLAHVPDWYNFRSLKIA